MKNTLLLFSILIFSTSFAQEDKAKRKKSKFFMYWGYNRSSYTKSDITFTGDNYNFKLDDVEAKDRQTDFDLSYVLPQNLTIPQYNFRIGYYLKDNLILSAGIDHMKYVMVANQSSQINGKIDVESSAKYNGVYNNQSIILATDFLKFEHTDGLNYVNIQIDKVFSLLKTKNNNIQIDYSIGNGIGFLLPKSNVRLLDNERNDKFHLAGYGISVQNGLRLTFFDILFLHYELKAGYINLPDIRTTQFQSDKAKQSFLFLERFCTLGVNVNI